MLEYNYVREYIQAYIDIERLNNKIKYRDKGREGYTIYIATQYHVSMVTHINRRDCLAQFSPRHTSRTNKRAAYLTADTHLRERTDANLIDTKPIYRGSCKMPGAVLSNVKTTPAYNVLDISEKLYNMKYSYLL